MYISTMSISTLPVWECVAKVTIFSVSDELFHYHAGFKHGIYFKTAFTNTKQAKPLLRARFSDVSICFEDYCLM